MCGIAGIVDLAGGNPPDSAIIRRMISSMRHRGPDEFGIYLDDRVGLGHARLSIIDLATGQQPMTDEEGSTVIVYNGEVYNYVELRDELKALGRRFRTSSDTEVIVQAYLQWPTCSGARRWSAGSTASSPSPCGTPPAGAFSWPGTGSAYGRSITP
jgi:asparagine synthase (glutamine-hydrolysing)